MKKPTGKLAFAYKTIMELEAKLEKMEKQNDMVTTMWSNELHAALDALDVVCEYHVPNINPLSDSAVLIARATSERIRKIPIESEFTRRSAVQQC